MTGDWTLRRASTGDAELIAGIFSSSRRAAMPYLPPLYTELEVLEWIRDIVLPKSSVTLVASSNDEIGGFASVRDGWLDHLYVAPPFQGQGLGARLLAAAKDESPCGLRLHVFQPNLAARRFYERRGFKLVEMRSGSSNEEGEPDAAYEWIGSGRPR
jgi:GNAT superfamily N-acetyltransferase